MKVRAGSRGSGAIAIVTRSSQVEAIRKRTLQDHHQSEEDSDGQGRQWKANIERKKMVACGPKQTKKRTINQKISR